MIPILQSNVQKLIVGTNSIRNVFEIYTFKFLNQLLIQYK